jgi:hypothetical protein
VYGCGVGYTCLLGMLVDRFRQERNTVVTQPLKVIVEERLVKDRRGLGVDRSRSLIERGRSSESELRDQMLCDATED